MVDKTQVTMVAILYLAQLERLVVAVAVACMVRMDRDVVGRTALLVVQVAVARCGSGTQAVRAPLAKVIRGVPHLT